MNHSVIGWCFWIGYLFIGLVNGVALFFSRKYRDLIDFPEDEAVLCGVLSAMWFVPVIVMLVCLSPHFWQWLRKWLRNHTVDRQAYRAQQDQRRRLKHAMKYL